MNTLNKLALVALALGAAVAAQAQSIDLLVLRSDGVWRVIPGSNTGGRFVRASLPPVFAGGLPVVGYTDRVSRGEMLGIATKPDGGPSNALEMGLTSTRGQLLRYTNRPVLFLWGMPCLSVNPLDDNMVAYVRTASSYVSTRIPIGTR